MLNTEASWSKKCNTIFPQLKIRLSTKNIADWIIFLHDPYHLTMSQLMLYGKEDIMVKSSAVSGTWSQYKVEPIEVNYISQDHETCMYEEEKVTDLWECITDHMYSKINCTLPWAPEAKDREVNLCSLPKEYLTYSTITMSGIYQNSEYIEKVAKCNPRCKRIEYSAKLNYASSLLTAADEWRLEIYFAKDKFPVKDQFYIYSTANLIADFGGYLGLLLGYSLLGFYDTLLDFSEYMIKKCKQKYHAKSDRK